MSDIEIAKAVAEACGWRWYDHGTFLEVDKELPGVDRFDPANDLRHAWLAAEAVGLFRQGASLWEFAPGVWEICFHDDEVPSVRAETPAKAISLAVLRLKAGVVWERREKERTTDGE